MLKCIVSPNVTLESIVNSFDKLQLSLNSVQGNIKKHDKLRLAFKEWKEIDLFSFYHYVFLFEGDCYLIEELTTISCLKVAINTRDIEQLAIISGSAKDYLFAIDQLCDQYSTKTMRMIGNAFFQFFSEELPTLVNKVQLLALPDKTFYTK